MNKSGLEFSQLLLRYDRTLLRYILTFVPRRDDAEEILQRAAMSLWEKWSDYDPSREFFPWAVRFTYFEILNYRKELARERLIFDVEVLDALKSSQQSLDPLLDLQRDALQECLQTLDAGELALLRRRYSDSEPITSLATEHGKTAKALYRKLDRIRELISRCVQKRLAKEVGS